MSSHLVRRLVVSLIAAAAFGGPLAGSASAGFGIDVPAGYTDAVTEGSPAKLRVWNDCIWPATCRINWDTWDVTASSASDYGAVSGGADFNGLSPQTVDIPTTGDSLWEPTETLYLRAIDTKGTATTSDDAYAYHDVTIYDNDTKPTISIANASTSEGDSGNKDLSFTVSKPLGAQGATTVNYATSSGTATSGVDYVHSAGTVTWTSGEVGSKTITVPVVGDSLDEADETLTVTLSGASGNATISAGGSSATGTITDDDAQPTVAIGDVTATEGNVGTKMFSFSVALSAASGKSIAVNWGTAAGTASATTDFIAGSGSLDFSPGDTAKTVTVTVLGDAIPEPHETFTVDLSAPSNVTLGDASGLGTIENDDTPSISISDVTQSEGSGGTTDLTFTLAKPAPIGSVVTVDWATADATATAGEDYAAVGGTVTWLAGQTSAKTVTVQVTGDTVDEDDETFHVALTNPTSAVLGDDDALATITDDDDPPTVSITDASVVEGDSGQKDLTFTVSLSGPSGKSVAMDWATANGTATTPADYVAVPITPLTFAPGTITKPVTVKVVGDTDVEPDETMTLSLTSLSNATAARTSGVGTIKDDDAPDNDGDGHSQTTDCDDTNAAIHPGATDIAGNGVDEDCSGGDNPAADGPGGGTDADGDGSPATVDCNDANPGIRPGAVDVPGNGVDEDCAGGDAATATPRVLSVITHYWRYFAAYTIVTRLGIENVSAGSRLTLTCKGKGCRFAKKSMTFKKARKRQDLRRFFNFKKRRRSVVSKLRKGAVVEIRLTAPGHIGKYLRARMRRNKAPLIKIGCLAPGSNSRISCPM